MVVEKPRRGRDSERVSWAHPALRQRIHVWVWDVWCCDGGEVGDVWGDCREAEQTKQIGVGRIFGRTKIRPPWGCRCRNGKDVGVGERGCVGEGGRLIWGVGRTRINGPE